MFDKNADGLLQKDEAPGQMANFFDMIDQNKDGAIDLTEAEAAQKFREQQRKQQPTL